MNLEKIKNFIKEKTQLVFALIQKLKVSFLSLPPKKRIVVLASTILVLCLIVIGLTWGGNGEKTSADKYAEKAKQEEKVIFNGETLATGTVGQTLKLGSLEISFLNFKESSFATLELDSNDQRITKTYVAPQIKVFNNDSNQTREILIGMIDDRGNKYRLDYSVLSYVDDLKGFGRNMSIFPRIIQEGYVFFSNVNPEAKKLQLIIALNPSGEKVVFEIER